MIQVAPNLYRGPRPDDLRVLQTLGVKRIVNLESGVYDFFNHDTYEREEQHPADYGIELVHISLNDFTPPCGDQVFRVLNFMEVASITFPTYVHCLAGKDRTGYICAAYRMLKQGWTYERAVAQCKALGMHWWYYWWLPSLKRYDNIEKRYVPANTYKPGTL